MVRVVVVGTELAVVFVRVDARVAAAFDLLAMTASAADKNGKRTDEWLCTLTSSQWWATMAG